MSSSQMYGPAISAAGAAVALVVPARLGRRTQLESLEVSLSVAPVAAVTLTITGSVSGLRYSEDIVAAGPFSPMLGGSPLFEVGEQVTVALSAGAGAVVAKVNASARMVDV